jgi:hypothetical protein
MTSWKVALAQEAAPAAAPSVRDLLAVDREYRRKARAGKLPLVAPRRLNPSGRAWLPVLHTSRTSRRYTALFSNTATAHLRGRTGDWVVLYYSGNDRSGQVTVVTEWHGPLKGKRVVRGREADCLEVYGVSPHHESEVMRWEPDDSSPFLEDDPPVVEQLALEADTIRAHA